MSTPTLPSSLPKIPWIEVAEKVLPPTARRALRQVRVAQSVHVPATMSLTFEDPAYSLLDEGMFEIGKSVEILLSDGSDQAALEPVFSGLITGIGVEQSMGEDRIPMLVVDATDRSHALATVSAFKAWPKTHPGTIIEAIAKRHGLTAEIDNRAIEVWAGRHRMQTTSDRHFLWQLAVESGCEWFVEGETLRFRFRPEDAPAVSIDRRDLLRFSARYSAIGAPKMVEVTGWDSSSRSRLEAGTRGDEPPARATAPLFVGQRRKATEKLGGQVLLPTAGPEDAEGAGVRSKALAHELVDRAIHVEATVFASAQVRAGTWVEIADLTETLAGNYYVTDVVHEYGEESEALTHFTSAATPPALSADGATSPGPRDSWGRHGLVSALVTDVDDPKKAGRVKVTYPSLGDGVESDWARIVTPGAGQSRGLDLRPRVDDEVVVGFEQGRPERPFVLGGVWNEVHKPPHAAVEAAQVTGWAITSHVGHRITVSDGPEDAREGDVTRHVQIDLADGKTTVHIGEDGVTITVPDGNLLTLAAGDASIVLGEGDVTISGDNVEINAGTKASIGAGKVAVDADDGVAIDGGSAFEARAINAKLEAKAKTTIKGNAGVAIN